MKHYLYIALCCGFLATPLSHAKFITNVCEMNDVQLRAALMFESQRAHSFYTNYGCPCPYTRDALGRFCGRQSTYHQTGGRTPICYQRDITRQDLIEFRNYQCTGDPA